MTYVDALPCRAIVTRYLGPTNTRGSRIVADAGDRCRVTVGYRDELSGDARKGLATSPKGWPYEVWLRGICRCSLPLLPSRSYYNRPPFLTTSAGL